MVEWLDGYIATAICTPFKNVSVKELNLLFAASIQPLHYFLY